VITVPPDWRDALPGIDSAEFTHRIAEILNTSRSGRMAAQTFVLDDDIDPSNDDDLLCALATSTTRCPAPGHGRLAHASFARACPAEIRRRVLARWDG